MKLATTSNFKAILVFGLSDAHGDVAFGFAHQAVADHAARNLRAFTASHGAVVHRKTHRQGWRIDRLRLKRFSHRWLGNGIGNGCSGHTGDGDNVASFGFFDGNALQPAERHDLGCTAGFDNLAVRVQRMDLLVHLDGTRQHEAGQDTAKEVVAVKQGDKHFEFAVNICLWLWNMADDGFKHRRERAFTRARVNRGIAITTRGIKHREIELLVRCIERYEQIEHFVQHFLNTFVRTVDLVDDDDGAKAQSQRLARYELRLGHRAFG